MQSIKTWQAAQLKLNEVKEADPSAVAPLKQAFPEAPVIESQASTSKQANNSATPQDTLIMQAINHRMAAEQATDKPAENVELKKTEQLIIASKGAGIQNNTNEVVAKIVHRQKQIRRRTITRLQIHI